MEKQAADKAQKERDAVEKARAETAARMKKEAEEQAREQAARKAADDAARKAAKETRAPPLLVASSHPCFPRVPVFTRPLHSTPGGQGEVGGGAGRVEGQGLEDGGRRAALAALVLQGLAVVGRRAADQGVQAARGASRDSSRRRPLCLSASPPPLSLC